VRSKPPFTIWAAALHSTLGGLHPKFYITTFEWLLKSKYSSLKSTIRDMEEEVASLVLDNG
jgi:hypothetical protein